MSEKKHPLAGFKGTIQRSTSKRFEEKDLVDIEEIGVVPENRAFRIRHSPSAGPEKNLEPVKAPEISALVVPAAGKERTEILFRHPDGSGRLVGVVLDDDDRGEVDGVWVAEEGIGVDPDGEKGGY